MLKDIGMTVPKIRETSTSVKHFIQILKGVGMALPKGMHICGDDGIQEY